MAALSPARAALSVAVVDLIDGAPDLIATSAAAAQLHAVDDLDAELTALARRAAWSTGLGSALAPSRPVQRSGAQRSSARLPWDRAGSPP